MKFTRRQVTAGLAGGVALTSAVMLAQTPAPPASASAELQSARDQVKATAMRLAEQEVPMSAEPAFAFQV